MPIQLDSIRRGALLPLAILTLALAFTACKKPEPPPEAAPAPAPAPAAAPAPAPAPAGVTVVTLTLGSAIGADKKVTQEKDTFAKNDTIYASVGTTGAAPSAKLTARWSFEGKSGSKPVDEKSQSIAPTGDTVTEFDVKKASGWPTGDYKVEILLDDKSVATKAFRVQ